MALRFKDILNIDCGIRYIFSALELSSSFSSRVLLESPMLQNKEEIINAYKDLSNLYSLYTNNSDFRDDVSKISIILGELKDIRGSLNRLDEGITLDDIELFEIKNLSLINRQILLIVNKYNIESVSLPNLEESLNLLDPDQNRIPSFYIYDSYDVRLAPLRKMLSDDNRYNDELFYKINLLENSIRKKLADSLLPNVEEFRQSLYNLANLDILISKCKLIEKLKLSLPVISESAIEYTGMFNPEIEYLLNRDGKEYQKIDIKFDNKLPLLITGANMGGKSITLKTVALCQYMFQFIFGIPASFAKISPVDKIFLSSGDEQDYRRGLSSFAAEIKRINKMLTTVLDGKSVLGLTDEPARTTNPAEGTALASSLVELLSDHSSFSVITTHYNIDNVKCKKLRVKGYNEGRIDYSLCEVSDSDAPQEALTIAANLGTDIRWLEKARIKLKEINNKK